MLGFLRRLLWYLAVLVGILVFGGALAVVVVPRLTAALPVGSLIDRIGSDYLLAAAFGAVAIAALLIMVLARAAGHVEQSRPPEPEFVQRVPVLGAEFDDLVESGIDVRTLFSDESDRIREDLRETATRTLMRVENLSREEARRRVETGAWTDERVPSAFLSVDGSVPTSVRARAAIRGRTWVQYGASETADAIVRLAGAANGTTGGRQ
jgi:hypothetical protein